MEKSDKAILLAVAQELEQAGYKVNVIDENEITDTEECDAIYHMSRTNSVLHCLQAAEQRGIYVTNKPLGVRNCSRRTSMEIMDCNNIPQPAFFHQSTDDSVPTAGYPLWIKKSEGWSCHPCDVCFAASQADAERSLALFRENGITGVTYTRHIEGDLIKFYGIKEDFFHWYYPTPEKSKFGLEKINGTAKHYQFNCEQFRECVFKAAQAIGVDIFGGDAIVTENGEYYIIDFNDFPSFSCCHKEAATAISKLIRGCLDSQNKK